MSGVELIYGCVIVTQLATQAKARLRPLIADRAVVVMDGISPSEKVYALNANARRLGIASGMTRVEVETFGAVETLTRSQGEELSARTILCEAMGLFTPRMEERARGVDWECVLDLSGTERLLGEPWVLGQRIVRKLTQLGFSAHIAVCANADAGLSLARHAARQGAGEQAVVVVKAGEEARSLAWLPLDVLELEQEQQERFAAWGIKTLGELAALPEVDLIARMGQQGKQWCQRARGQMPYLLQQAREQLSLVETLEFDEPLETLDQLLFCLNPMLEQLISRAQLHTLALASVTVSLSLERCADRMVDMEESDQQAQHVAKSKPAQSTQAPLQMPGAEKPQRPVTLGERIQQYGRLPQLVAHATGLVGQAIDGRLKAASADPAVRKAWHTAALGSARASSSAKNTCASGKQRPSYGEAEVQKIAVNYETQAVSSSQLNPSRHGNDEVRDWGKWGKPFERTVRPAIATVDRALLLKMLQLDLEAHPAPGAVVRLCVSAEAGDASRIQLGLFAPPMPEPTRFEDTYARLTAVVGEGNLGRVRPADTHALEAFSLERFKLPAAANKAPVAREPGSRPATAVRRLRPPVEINVWTRDRSVVAFYFEARRFEVLRSYGPWRTSGCWWRPEVWSSDTWDVAARAEDEETLVCMLGHDLLSDRWYLVAMYD